MLALSGADGGMLGESRRYLQSVFGAGGGALGGVTPTDPPSPAAAALFNGNLGHSLDFDDTHTTMIGHPSGPVLPALLALGETEGAGGQALLAALVAGVELECRGCQGQSLIAEIVPQSVEELDIRPGSEVVAVFKASAFRRLY